MKTYSSYTTCDGFHFDIRMMFDSSTLQLKLQNSDQNNCHIGDFNWLPSKTIRDFTRASFFGSVGANT